LDNHANFRLIFLNLADNMVSIKSIFAIAVTFTAAKAQVAFKNSSYVVDPVIYSIPGSLTLATSFNVSVRAGQGMWQQVGTYSIDLQLINTTTGGSNIQKGSMAYFDFCNSVEISVTYNNGPLSTAQIRPTSYDIPTKVQGNTITFTLYKPRNIVIQVNNNIFDCLHLFTNEIEKSPPSSNDTNIIYFGAGVHSVTGGKLIVPSNKTVYIAGGGILTSPILFQNVTNSGIRGRGLIVATTIAYSSNIFVNGVISIKGGNILVGNSNDVVIDNYRAFSSAGWGDGMDFFCSQNVIVRNVFMRNSDDCVAIYQHRNNSGWNWLGDTKNITIKDSSLWADVAHPVMLGTHGNTANPEVMSDITVSNIDILDHREMQMDYQGAIAINAGDDNLIKDVYITDVRVENFRIGQLINMRVMFNTKYNTSPGRGIHNITINNLSYNGNHSNPSLMLGYDAERTISNIVFKNLTVNGLLISDTMKKPTWYQTSDFVPMYKNEHVVNLTFTN
jgi:hypothetical protein